jgi:hypothetical protein
MFSDEELNSLVIALNSKVIDDYYQIGFWKNEIKNSRSQHDKKYLEESKIILKRDIDLKNKIQDELYLRKFKNKEV